MSYKLLFPLVKSLSANEKGYVTKHCKGKKYLEFLNAISKQNVENLQTLKEVIGVSERVFATRQSETYQMLLKILRDYDRASATTAFQLKDRLLNLEVLYKRSLYNNCYKELEKIRSLAKEFEYYLVLEEANQWERKIIYAQQETKNLNQRSASLDKSSKENTAIIENKALYWGAFLRMFALARSGIFVSDDKSKQLGTLQEDKAYMSLLTNVDKALCHEAKVLFYFANALKETVRGNIELSKNYAQQLVTELEDYMPIYREDSSLYVGALSTLIAMYQLLEDFDTNAIYIKLLKDAPRTRADSEKEILTRYYQYKFAYLLNTKNFATEKDLIREIEEKQKKIKLAIIPGTFDFFSGVTMFFNKKYRLALYYFDEVDKHLKGSKKRKDTRSVAKVLHYLCKYELKETEYVSDKARNAYDFAKANHLLDEPKRLILQFFSKVYSFNHKEEKEALRVLKEAINAYKNTHGLSGLLNYFDVLYWLELKGC